MSKAHISSDEPGNEPDPEVYDRWFRGKVREAMISERPFIPHDEAMAKVASMLIEKRRRAVHVENLTDAEAAVYIEAFSAPLDAGSSLPSEDGRGDDRPG